MNAAKPTQTTANSKQPVKPGAQHLRGDDEADDLTLELNSVFVGITRATSKGGDAFTSTFDLTPARVAVISALYRHPDTRLTVGEIATMLHVSSTNISRRLDGLERDGWVQRDRNPDDGRSIYISLTPAGMHRAEQIMPAIFRRVHNVWSCYSEDEKQLLLDYLSRFLTHVQTSSLLRPPGGD
ncbi:MAG TPA: MarR family transcriptional regulator [Dehalococcoidia bacterium]|nr:MarR family transcriptional regulator [Dehalococcoidia bacterium]